MRKALSVAFLLAASQVLHAANAADKGGSVYGYYSPTGLDLTIGGNSIDTDGNSVGVRGLFPVAGAVLWSAEYERTSVEHDADDITQLRTGVLVRIRKMFGLAAEYVSADFNSSNLGPFKGFGLHARADRQVGDAINLWAQVGYLMLRDDDLGALDGLEYSVGGAYELLPNWSAFTEWRQSRLKADDNDFDAELSHLRVGARYDF